MGKKVNQQDNMNQKLNLVIRSGKYRLVTRTPSAPSDQDRPSSSSSPRTAPLSAEPSLSTLQSSAPPRSAISKATTPNSEPPPAVCTESAFSPSRTPVTPTSSPTSPSECECSPARAVERAGHCKLQDFILAGVVASISTRPLGRLRY